MASQSLFKVQMFSDFVCPFCYIGFEVVRRLKPEFNFELEWRGFQIHPEWPAEGLPAAALHSDGAQRAALWSRIEALARSVGLEMQPPAVLTNSRLALEAAEFARERGVAEEFEAGIYRAYFHDGANIGDPKLVIECARQAGIPDSELTAALDSGRYAMRLKNNALIAHQRGVSGVPTFYMGQYPLVGAQSVDAMRQVLSRARERLAG